MIRIYTENDHDAPDDIRNCFKNKGEDYYYGILVADNPKDEKLAELIGFDYLKSRDCLILNSNDHEYTAWEFYIYE